MPTDKKFTYQITPLNSGNISSYYYARPSSYHTGGVNVAMCGGEVFFMRDDIDYKVYEQLMTPDGKHSDMPGDANAPTTFKGYTLNDSDYKYATISQQNRPVAEQAAERRQKIARGVSPWLGFATDNQAPEGRHGADFRFNRAEF